MSIKSLMISIIAVELVVFMVYLDEKGLDSVLNLVIGVIIFDAIIIALALFIDYIIGAGSKGDRR